MKLEFNLWMQYVRLVILEEKMQKRIKTTEQEWRDWYELDVGPILAARAEIEKHRD